MTDTHFVMRLGGGVSVVHVIFYRFCKHNASLHLQSQPYPRPNLLFVVVDLNFTGKDKVILVSKHHAVRSGS